MTQDHEPRTVSREHLEAAILDIGGMVDDWRRRPIEMSETAEFRGERVKRVDTEILDAFDELSDMVDRDEIGRESWELVLAIDELIVALNDWTERYSINPDANTPECSDAVWAAWDAGDRRSVVECLRPRVYPLPEPIAELTAMPGMSDVQICRQYGFVDRHGNPAISTLHEERRTPGTHFNADTWQHPTKKRHDAELAERWAKRPKRAGIPINRPVPAGPAPESLEELLAQQVPAKQIARMKGISEEEVRAAAEELGLTLDGRQLVPTVDAAEAARNREAEALQLAQERMELQRRSRPDIEDMEERILTLSIEEGWKPKQIADALAMEYPALNWQKVNRIVKEAERGQSIPAA